MEVEGLGRLGQPRGVRWIHVQSRNSAAKQPHLPLLGSAGFPGHDRPRRQSVLAKRFVSGALIIPNPASRKPSGSDQLPIAELLTDPLDPGVEARLARAHDEL